MDDLMNLRIRVNGDDLEDGEVAAASRNLRTALLTLDVEDVVTPTAGPPEPGAKSGLMAALGLLLVSTGPSVVPAVVDVALSWLKRQPIDVSLEIDGQRFSGQVTRAQRDALVQSFLDRHE